MIGLLSAIAVAGGLLVGRWVSARHQSKVRAAGAPEEKSNGEPLDAEAAPARDSRAPEGETAIEAAPPAENVDWSVFPCTLGDVVMRTLDNTEAWLAGALVFREDAAAAVLFIAPDAAGERAIYARPLPTATLGWLAPVKREAVLVGAEPPSAIELEGTRFERKRRLPLRAQRVGTGTPDVTGTAIVGEYVAATGEIAIIVIADGVGRAWRGGQLREDEYEVWSGERAR